MSDVVFLQSGIVTSGLTIYYDVQNEDGDIYNTTTEAFQSPDAIDYPTDGFTIMAEVGSSGQYEASFPSSLAADTYEINIRQRTGANSELTDQVIKTVRRYWDGTSLYDPAYATVISAGAISATFVEHAWIWRFEAPDQMTASNVINEVVEFSGLLGMTFDRVISPNVVIQSALVESITEGGDELVGTDVGVETTGDILLSPNRRAVYIPTLINASGEYVYAVKIVTTDSQNYIRRGILAAQPIVEIVI